MRQLCLLMIGYLLVIGCGSSSTSSGSKATPTRTRVRSTNTPGGATNTPGGATATPAGPSATPGGPTHTPKPTETPGGPTKTVTPTVSPAAAQVLFVRASGNDQNSGTSFDQALKSLTTAAGLLRPGATVYVGPGRYLGRVEISGLAGTAASPVVLIADTGGSHTHDAPGAVIIDGNGDTVALLVTKSTYLTLDGFTITGTAPKDMPKQSATAVHARSTSAHFSMRNCIIANGTTSDGIRVELSSDALIFDNLIFANDRGIIVSGDSPNAFVINNTVADCERTGILLLQKTGAAPTDATLMNNVIQQNGNDRAIQVDQGPPSAEVGYAGDFNLVFEPDAMDQTANYLPTTVRGSKDVNEDAKFVNLDQGDVHLDTGSPAIDAGSGSIDAKLLSELLKRSTTADGNLDRAPVDMGYHYPAR